VMLALEPSDAPTGNEMMKELIVRSLESSRY